MVIYNVPHHTVIDIFSGNTCQLICDNLVPGQKKIFDDCILPARNFYHVAGNGALKNIYVSGSYILSSKVNVLLIHNLGFAIPAIIPDVVIIAGNPSISLRALYRQTHCRYYVFDASNTVWKISDWEKEAEQLHLRHYSVPGKGAFIMQL